MYLTNRDIIVSIIENRAIIELIAETRRIEANLGNPSDIVALWGFRATYRFISG